MKTPDLNIGSALRLVQKHDLATHITTGDSTRSICGLELGNFHSFNVPARIQGDRTIRYLDGSPAKRYVDCKRCFTICTNHSIS